MESPATEDILRFVAILTEELAWCQCSRSVAIFVCLDDTCPRDEDSEPYHCEFCA